MDMGVMRGQALWDMGVMGGQALCFSIAAFSHLSRLASQSWSLEPPSLSLEPLSSSLRAHRDSPAFSYFPPIYEFPPCDWGDWGDWGEWGD